MARKPLFRTKNYPYHLSVRVNNREPFPGSMPSTWRALTSELHIQHILHGLRVHAFVLMDNHFHLIATSPQEGIDIVMRDFLSSGTRILNARTRRSGRIFGSRYFWSVIQTPSYYAHALKYVTRNPARAGLCEYVADYPFSTYAGLVGAQPLRVPVLPPLENMGRLIPADASSLDIWLNRAHQAEESDAIRRALRRKQFRIAPRRGNRKICPIRDPNMNLRQLPGD